MSVEQDLEAYKDLSPVELNYEFRRILDFTLIEPAGQVGSNLVVINPKEAAKRFENDFVPVLCERFNSLMDLSAVSPALKKDAKRFFKIHYGFVGGFSGREKEKITYLAQDVEGIFEKDIAKQAQRDWFWSEVDEIGEIIQFILGRFSSSDWEWRADSLQLTQCEFFLHYGELP